MNIIVIQNGKIKDQHIVSLRNEYVKRFQRYGKLELLEQQAKPQKSLWPERARWRVLLDERGKSYTSEQFAKLLEQWSMQHGAIAFAIGDAYGHDDLTQQESDASIRLSDFVMPHQLAHLVLIEQIYRAGCILNNNPYHHA